MFHPLLGYLPSTNTVSLQKVQTKQRPQKPTPPVVGLQGRTPGFFGWLLSVVGLGNTTTLMVSADELRFDKTGFSGKTLTIVPLSEISLIESGKSKNVALLIAGFATMFPAIVALFQAGVIPFALVGVVALIFLLAFFMSTNYVLAVRGADGSSIMLKIKPSKPSGIKFDEAQLTSITRVIFDLVRDAKGLTGGSYTPPPDPSPQPYNDPDFDYIDDDPYEDEY